MRNEYPSHRWLKQFDAAFVAQGGHDGYQTLKVCREKYAIPLYQRGQSQRPQDWLLLLLTVCTDEDRICKSVLMTFSTMSEQDVYRWNYKIIWRAADEY